MAGINVTLPFEKCLDLFKTTEKPKEDKKKETNWVDTAGKVAIVIVVLGGIMYAANYAGYSSGINEAEKVAEKTLDQFWGQVISKKGPIELPDPGVTKQFTQFVANKASNSYMDLFTSGISQANTLYNAGLIAIYTYVGSKGLTMAATGVTTIMGSLHTISNVLHGRAP